MNADNGAQCGRDKMWSTAQGEPHRNREDPLSIGHARQGVVDEVGGGVLGAARLIITGLHATGIADFPIQGHKTVDDAIAWLARASSKVRPEELRPLVGEARARADRASA